MLTSPKSPPTLPDPRPILAALPSDRREPLRRQWLRRNVRSQRWWLGVSLLCLLPFAGLLAFERFVLPRVAAPSREMRSLVLGGGALAGCALGLRALQTRANPVALPNLRSVLAKCGLCPRCGSTLNGDADCPRCKNDWTKETH